MAYLRPYIILILGILLTGAASSLAWAKMDDSALRASQVEFETGSRYYHGRGVKKDLDAALLWYLKSAEKGHAKSELAVSQVLAFGDPKNRRYEEALHWLLKAEGPHKTPQISGQAKAEASAKKNLKWMCKKGLVDFPESHPLAADPTCWLNRGKRLLYGVPRADYYLRKDKKKYYGVIKKDYVASRHYLEKAFSAGETDAAIHLAKIYGKGLGTPKDIKKSAYYTERASEIGHGDSTYRLAERAKAAGDAQDYVAKLKSAAEGRNWKAPRDLAWAYYNGDSVDQNHETAFMYFFLAGHPTFVRQRDARHGDTRLPFFENKFLPIFQTEISLETLESAHQSALSFAKENNFRRYDIKKIERSYNRAVSDFYYVQDTGGEWHKSDIFSNLTVTLIACDRWLRSKIYISYPLEIRTSQMVLPLDHFDKTNRIGASPYPPILLFFS